MMTSLDRAEEDAGASTGGDQGTYSGGLVSPGASLANTPAKADRQTQDESRELNLSSIANSSDLSALLRHRVDL